MGNKLDAREYKLLLDPAAFDMPPSLDAANRFWRQRLEPVIVARLDRRADGRPRATGEFKAPVERIVRYWDTQDCTLTRSDFCLRTRVAGGDAKAASPRTKITLKLRMTDYFVVASTRLPCADGRGGQKLEEDIAPLEVSPGGVADGVVLPARRSVRSRYALSSEQERRWPLPSPNLGGVMALYPTLAQNLAEPPGAAADQQLRGGPDVHEFAFEGPRVRLGGGCIGAFTLTLWQFDAKAPSPAVAEISFKCATIDGGMPGKAAARALTLFVAIQTDLHDCVNRAHSSKTVLALPRACGRLA